LAERHQQKWKAKRKFEKLNYLRKGQPRQFRKELLRQQLREKKVKLFIDFLNRT
jgi:hypothetical protein